jgi:hypothetical protein
LLAREQSAECECGKTNETVWHCKQLHHSSQHSPPSATAPCVYPIRANETATEC